MKKITFIVIAYNEEKTITNCLKSISELVVPKGYVYHTLVINDGSKDKTSDVVINIIKKYMNIKLVDFKENKGRGFARHEGIKRAKGDYLAFIDADITLPKDWLKRTLQYLNVYDAVGGIAIPDGDSTYICQKFNLEPKSLPHTNGITGSNSIYKSEVFKNIDIDPNLRGGEDTDIVLKMIKKGYKLKLIKKLIVDHHEDINFRKSLKRMFAFGKGATNLLNTGKKIRTPDISFFMFLLLVTSAIYFSLSGNFYFIILLIFYPLFVSYLHLFKKFKFGKFSGFIYGGLVNYFMISSYLVGRLVGYFSKE